jgi:hypothetical protein
LYKNKQCVKETVAHATFFLLKLPNYGLFIILALLGLECHEAKIGFLQAMETLRVPET